MEVIQNLFMWILTFLAVAVICMNQVSCQTNLTNCGSENIVNTQSPCCLHLCNVNGSDGSSCLNSCPTNMTLQNVTRTELYNCASTGSDVTNSSIKEEGFVLVCWSKCPNGTYEDNVLRKCITCDNECITCSGHGTSTSNCTCKNVKQEGHCVPDCNDRYYKNNNQECIQCNDLCIRCTGSGSDKSVCTCRFNFNDTCVDACPNGTKVDDNNHCKNIEKPEGEDNHLIIIAAAAGGGGGALLIIIIVVIVCCCCRRKKTPKSRMSMIIEERDDPKNESGYNPENIQLPVRKGKNKRANYENVNKPDDADVAKIAQQTLDKKYRYVKDPTETIERENKKNKRKPSGSEEIYENQETINRQKRLGDKPLMQVMSRKWKKSKKALKNRFSKNISNTKTGASNKGFVEEPSSANDGFYLDMGGNNSGQEEYLELDQKQATSGDVHVQEDYMQLDGATAASHDKSTNYEQENYANFDPHLRNNTTENDECVDQEEYENFDPAQVQGRIPSSRGQHGGDSDSQYYNHETIEQRTDEDENVYVNASAYRLQ